ncbi:MAG: hypothetical protein AABX93_03360 [Nanoarchaeota archaeon]
MNKIKELQIKIAYAEKKKKEFLHYVEALKRQNHDGGLSHFEFLEHFYKKHNGKNIREWIEHLEHNIMEYKREINRARIHTFFFGLV